MDFIDQLLETSMDAINLDINDRQKAKLKEAMQKIIKDGETPYKAMGFGLELMEHLYDFGCHLYNSGNYKKALDVFSALRLLKIDEYRFAFAYAASCHKLKNYKEAILAYVSSANKDKEASEPFYYLYDCFMQVGLTQEAFEALSQAIKRCGDRKDKAQLKAKCLMIQSSHTSTPQEDAKEIKLIPATLKKVSIKAA